MIKMKLGVATLPTTFHVRRRKKQTKQNNPRLKNKTKKQKKQNRSASSKLT